MVQRGWAVHPSCSTVCRHPAVTKAHHALHALLVLLEEVCTRITALVAHIPHKGAAQHASGPRSCFILVNEPLFASSLHFVGAPGAQSFRGAGTSKALATGWYLDAVYLGTFGEVLYTVQCGMF